MENKTILFFWGNTKMSWLRYMTLYSFRKYNPDWLINLYVSDQKIHTKTWKTYEEQDFFMYAGNDYMDNIKDLNINTIEYTIKDKKGNEISPSQKSNFFKWQLLATNGGFYSDMDILFFRSINDLYEKTKEYDIGLTYTWIFSVGFMFSKGNNLFFQDVYNECLNKFDADNYQGASATALRKWPNIQAVEDQYKKVYNIPKDYFINMTPQ